MGAFIALLVLVVYPLTELAAASLVASWIGWGPVLLIGVASFVLGLVVMGRAGRRAAAGLNEAARVGSLPGGEVGDSALLFLAGLLLALPGLVTSAAGLLLLVPPLRGLVRRVTGRTVGRRIRARGYSVTTATVDGVTVTRLHEGDVIPGEVVERHDGPPAPPPGPPTALPPS